MAMKEGQAPLACQMCEDTTEIKWKCLTCSFLICTKCRKIHQKVKSAIEHNIIDIKDIASYLESGSNPDFRKIKCFIHQGQSLHLFCKDCHKGLCQTCVGESHIGHTMAELKEGYGLSIEKIKNVHGRIDEQTSRLKEGLSTLTLIKSNEKMKQEKLKQEIMKQKKDLTDAIKAYSNKLLNEVSEKWQNLYTRIENEEANTLNILQDLDDKKNILSNAINSNDAGEIFRICQRNVWSVSGDPPSINTSLRQQSVFDPIRIKESSIKSLFGSLENSFPFKTDLKVVQQYITDRPCVDDIACCNDGSLWMNDFRNNRLHHVTLSNESIQSNPKIKQEVVAMALTNAGDLLLSNRNTELQVVPQSSGKLQKSKYSVAKLITTAVYVTKDDKVLVGARESGPAHPTNGKYGARKLIVMNEKGEHEKVHQYYNSKELFRYVYRITTDSDDNIYVIDNMSDDYRGGVVVLGWKGDVRGEYGGHPDVNNYINPFKPHDIKSTEQNVIIVTDKDNSLLHFLNNNGQCLKYYNTKDLGFELPLSLGMDKKGYVYVGCDTSKGHRPNAKLVVFQIV